MNRKTARGLRKLAKAKGISQHEAKRDFLKLPAGDRFRVRKLLAKAP